MNVVDFYKLPRAIQDRFVGSVTSGFPPAPILAKKGGTPTRFLWLGLTLACFVVLLVAARVGFGVLDSGLSRHSVAVVPVYVLLVFGFLFGLVQAYGRVVRERALPFVSGVYLFPACLIDATSDRFRVYAARELASVDLQGTSVRVVFAGGARFVFPTARPEDAVALVQEVQAARDHAMQAQASEDPKELVAVDPLHVPRFSSPVGPRNAYEMKRPVWGRLGAPLAAALALALGGSLWSVRNARSDRQMYAVATKANDAASYRLYLDHGSRFKAEVGDILLPRAELRDAEKVGTVEALLAYKDEHPDSKIAPEVAASVRAAMLVELGKAKAPGTLASLHAFAAKHPDHGVDRELAEAVHAVYARELDAYKERAHAKDKNAVAFVARLFAWGEKHGKNIEVRLRRKSPTTLERADKFLLKAPSFMGVATYPSRYFDDKHAVAREAILTKALVELGPALSPELFTVAIGPVVPTDEELPATTVPTLFVTHVAEWSGHSYRTTRPRGNYVGMNFNFEASFVIPGDPKPYRFRQTIFRPAATQILKELTPTPGPGEAAEQIYETMGREAFEKFVQRLLANF